jgi:hypothetical protein
MANNDMGMHEANTYKDIAQSGAVVLGLTVILTFLGFVVHDCNEANYKSLPEQTKQLQEKQKLQVQCLASICPQGQYRVFNIRLDGNAHQDGSCYCDVRLLK